MPSLGLAPFKVLLLSFKGMCRSVGVVEEKKDIKEHSYPLKFQTIS